MILLKCHCEEQGDEAIRRSRCEGEARGNLKRSLASFGTRIASLRPTHHTVQGFARNDMLLFPFIFSLSFNV